jgi:hypothetical protein
MNFINFYMLQEQLKRSDLIDVYILMSMPDIDDPSAKFIKDEIMAQVKSNIIEELQKIITKEFLHIKSQEYCENVQKIKDFMTFEAGPWYSQGLMLTPRFISKQRDQATKLRFIQDFVKDFNLSNTYYSEDNKKQNITIEDFKLFAKAFDLNIPKDFVDVFDNHKEFRQTIYKIYTTSINNNQIPVRYIYRAFTLLKWNTYYGGKNWAKITEHTIKILSTKDSAEFFKELDRLVDFVHNTGSILSKFQGYKQGWIQFILDIKEKATNIRELIPLATPEVRKMFSSQEWRTFMTKIPGEGAETSIDGYKALMLKYITNLSDLLNIEIDEDINEINATLYVNALDEVWKQIGTKRTEAVLDTIPSKLIVRAVIASNLLISSQNPKLLKKTVFLKKYAERKYPDLTMKAIRAFESNI